MRKEDILNTTRTKYNYFMSNKDKFLDKTAITYAIPIEKGPTPEDSVDLNREYKDVKISRKELIEKIDKTADALAAMGIKKGDIVTICSSNTPETIYMDYALNKIGAVPHYIYPNATIESIRYFLNQTGSEYLFYLDQPEIENNVLEGIKETKVKNLISTSVLEPFPEIFKLIAQKGKKKQKKTVADDVNAINWKELMKIGSKNKGLAKEVPYDENAICSLVNTSGTSSTPKMVMESNNNINSIVKNYYISKQEFVAGDSYLQVLPVFVEYGKVTTHIALCHGLEIIMIPEMNPKAFPGLMKKYKANYTTVTPAHWDALTKSKNFDNEDMSYLKLAGCGGDGFSSVEDRINSFLAQHNSPLTVIDGYGATEVTACAVSNFNHAKKKGSLGKPIGETEVKIFKLDTEEELPAGEIGEIAISGPTVTMGYFGDEEETKEIFKKHKDGKVYAHLKDLGMMDPEGFVHYNGRMKNVIARSGFKFSPVEVEMVIQSHPNVLKCSVVAMYDKKERQVPSAHITLKNYDNVSQTLSEIIELVNDKIEEFHRPVSYKVRQDIPLTKNNKTNTVALRIEDIASTIPGVLYTKIIPIKDANYDYDLYIEYNPELNTEKQMEKDDIINYIEDIMENEMLLGNSIRYNIDFVNKKYTDSNVKKVKYSVKVLS